MTEDYDPDAIPRTDGLELALLSKAENAEDYRDLWGKILDDEVFKKIDQKLTGGEADLDVASLSTDEGVIKKTPTDQFGAPLSLTPEATHYPYARGFTTDEFINAPWVEDHRNPVFDHDHFRNEDLFRGHTGSPHVIGVNGQIHMSMEMDSEDDYRAEAAAFVIGDSDGADWGGPAQYPEFGDQVDWGEGSEADPTPIYVPEHQKWYMLATDRDPDDDYTWKTYVAEGDDLLNWEVRDDVGVIMDESHKALVRVGDKFHIIYGSMDMYQKTTTVDQFPGGWSDEEQIASRDDLPEEIEAWSNQQEIVKCEDGWVLLLSDGYRTGIHAFTTSFEEFPYNWEHETEMVPAGEDGDWNSSGYRNPRVFCGNGDPMLFIPGNDEAEASDSTIGIWRLHQNKTYSETIRPDTFRPEGEFTTTSTNWETIAMSMQYGDTKTLQQALVRIHYSLSNDTDGETTEVRLRNVAESEILASLSSTGTGTSFEDSGWRGPHNLSEHTSDPRTDDLRLEARVSGGEGTIETERSPGVLIKTHKGRL
ncbi:hypothetical protein ACLI4Y_16595 [Natrialbaceae archaeon A-CW3]